MVVGRARQGWCCTTRSTLHGHDQGLPDLHGGHAGTGAHTGLDASPGAVAVVSVPVLGL